MFPRPTLLTLVLALALAACASRRAAPPPATVAPSRFPLRRHVRYREVERRPGTPPTETIREERLELSRTEPDGTEVYTDTTSGQPGYNETFLAPDGTLGNAASWDATTSALGAYAPRQVVLPAHPVVGMRWESGHRIGARVSSTSRRCVLEASDRCRGGLVSRCVSDLATGARVELASHFCPGVGWVGDDDNVLRDGRLILEVHDDRVEDVGGP